MDEDDEEDEALELADLSPAASPPSEDAEFELGEAVVRGCCRLRPLEDVSGLFEDAANGECDDGDEAEPLCRLVGGESA